MIGAAVTGDHNATKVHYRKVTLPPGDRVDIRSELAALKELLVGLNTGNRTKIANALAEAADDAAKPQADKNEIGGALERALGYAGMATDFGDKAEKIAAHVQNAVGWLGDTWHSCCRWSASPSEEPLSEGRAQCHHRPARARCDRHRRQQSHRCPGRSR
jgi:hypothetical protein